MEVVVDLLSKATSQNQEVIKIAEQQLKCLETEAGYYLMLMDIILDRSIETNCRWLASVCLKNGIDRYWRKTAPNAISEGEKASIRQKLLLFSDEPVNQIAAQIALVIAKIARLDFPSDWPELFQTLLNLVQQPDDLYQQRSILVLHQVIKTLASKRLGPDQKLFQEMTANLFPIAIQLWTNYSNTFLKETENAHSDHKRLIFEKCLLCLKILRNLVVYGFKTPSEEPGVSNFMMILFQQFKPFIEYRKCFSEQTGLKEICEKYLVLLSKVLLTFLEQHPMSFVDFIRPSLECAVTICFTQEYKDALFARLVVNLFNLIKSIILCQEYRRPGRGNEEICNIYTEFFTYSILTEVYQQLIFRFFLLTEEEIQMWRDDPEEFAIGELGESWKYDLRPSSEVLLVSLMRLYDFDAEKFVCDLFKDLPNMQDDSMDSILKKDALLNAMSLLCFDVNHCDWKDAITDYLFLDLQKDFSHSFIIRRRIMLLFGNAVGVFICKEKFHILYEVLLQFLRPEENIVVRLAAAKALKSTIDTFSFEKEDFLPLYDRYMGNLFNLLKDTKECDLKMFVLDVITFVIERAKSHETNHLISLVMHLKLLWETAGENIMLCCSIITCFSKIIEALRKLSTSLHGILIPIITLSTDLTHPAHTYLVEDALILWSDVVSNVETCSPELLDLAKNLIPLLECGFHIFSKSTDILIMYLWLTPVEFLEKYGMSIVKTFSYIITDLSDEGLYSLGDFVKEVLTAFPIEGPKLFKPIISTILASICVEDPENSTLAWRECILSQVVLYDQKCFESFFQEKAVESGRSVDELFRWYLSCLLKKIASNIVCQQKKLLAMGLISLLTSNSSIIHEMFGEIISEVLKVLNELTTKIFGQRCEDLFYMDKSLLSEDDDDSNDSPHDKRMFRRQFKDPIYSVILKDYFKCQMSALEHSIGTGRFDELMEKVDHNTLQILQQYVSEI